MRIPDVVGSVGVIGAAATVAGGGAYGGYKLQGMAANGVKAEQERDAGRADEARSTGRPLEADQIERDAPSDRERNWDKVGVMGLGGVAGGVAAGIVGFGALYETDNAATRLGRIVSGGAAVAGLVGGVALVGMGVGALVSGSKNQITGV